MWWIGTGLASSFPFHATGDSDARLTETAYYRVVSSYTPSIKALTYARERSSTTPLLRSNPWKLLIVTMSSTPGADNLPGVEKEKSAVVEALGRSVSAEILEQTDVVSVMHRIQQYRIAHFACHGVSNPSYPSVSRTSFSVI